MISIINNSIFIIRIKKIFKIERLDIKINFHLNF
jgi:hypothetical protein